MNFSFRDDPRERTWPTIHKFCSYTATILSGVERAPQKNPGKYKTIYPVFSEQMVISADISPEYLAGVEKNPVCNPKISH